MPPTCAREQNTGSCDVGTRSDHETLEMEPTYQDARQVSDKELVEVNTEMGEGKNTLPRDEQQHGEYKAREAG